MRHGPGRSARLNSGEITGSRRPARAGTRRRVRPSAATVSLLTGLIFDNPSVRMLSGVGEGRVVSGRGAGPGWRNEGSSLTGGAGARRVSSRFVPGRPGGLLQWAYLSTSGFFADWCVRTGTAVSRNRKRGLTMGLWRRARGPEQGVQRGGKLLTAHGVSVIFAILSRTIYIDKIGACLVH